MTPVLIWHTQDSTCCTPFWRQYLQSHGCRVSEHTVYREGCLCQISCLTWKALIRIAPNKEEDRNTANWESLAWRAREAESFFYWIMMNGNENDSWWHYGGGPLWFETMWQARATDHAYISLSTVHTCIHLTVHCPYMYLTVHCPYMYTSPCPLSVHVYISLSTVRTCIHLTVHCPYMYTSHCPLSTLVYISLSTVHTCIKWVFTSPENCSICNVDELCQVIEPKFLKMHVK